MSIEAQQTLEVPIENVSDLAKFLVHHSGSQNIGNQIVHVSDVTAPVLQVQDAITGGTVIQLSDETGTPVVQMPEAAQPIYITEGYPNAIQIVDGPFIQSSDGTSIIQLAGSGLVSGGNVEGLTQIVQFAGGQVALVEQQENIDPHNVQYVLEQSVANQQQQHVVSHGDGEIQLQQQMLMDTAAPEHIIKQDPQSYHHQPDEDIIIPPIGKGPFTCEICEKKLDKWNQYQRHMKSHADDKPFRCFNCPASFNIADNLKLHLATHVEPGDKPVCPECGKKFSRVASLKAHIMMHEKEENLMCPECGDEFSLQGQLDKHMLDHQEDREGTRVYSCRQCNATYSNHKDLKEHTKQHFKIRKSMSHRTYKKEIDRSGFSHKCKHCMKTFQKPSQLLRHERVHTGDRPFECKLCTKAFNQKGALQMHILGRHTGDKPHKCQFCKAGFSQKGNLRAHVQRVHTITNESIDQTLYKCHECPCIFKKLGSLNAHISRFHFGPIENERNLLNKPETEEQNKDGSNNVIQQLLELSGNGTTTQVTGQQVSEDILQQALQNSGLPGSTTNNNANNTDKASSGGTMSVVNVRDTATGAIKKHYVRKLGSTTWHQCSFCMKEFKKPSDLVRHTRIHSHEKPYKCTQCFRAFAVKSTLNSHIKTHTGIKQYKCNVCDKCFSTQGSLKVHLRLHTGAKPFDCMYCDKKFRTQAHRRNHLAGHFKGPSQKRLDPELKKLGNLSDVTLQEPILITDTGFIQQPPRSTLFNQYLGDSGSLDRPYKCTHCQRAFKKSSHLKQHIRSHTGEKPYKCVTCNRTFVSNGVLKAHIRIHTGLKHYKCVMCDNLFSTNGSLKRHMSTHSEVRPFMCPYCQRTFKTNVNCRKHMKTHRLELALQMKNEQQQQLNIQTVGEQTVETDIGDTEQYVEEEAVDNDLTLVNDDINQSTTITPDLGQQTILTQGLQDALGLGSGNLDNNLLNQQQMFSTQQTFTQSLLGSGQQNFQQMNTQIANVDQQQNQYHIQQQQLGQMDLNNFTQQTDNVIHIVTSGDQVVTETVQSVQALSNEQQQEQPSETDSTQYVSTETLPSTSMQNILETSDTAQTEEAPTEELETSTATGSNDRRKIYTCEYCSKIFKKSSHHKQHIRSHTGEKPYKCQQCTKTFVAMGVLRQHMRTHTGVKEYKCSVCHALFSTNGSLTRHMNTHVSVKPYKCPFCLEGFRTAGLCKKHMREHTGGDEEEEQPVQSENKPTVPALTTKKSRSQLLELPQSIVQKANPDLNISEKILVESASEKDRISEVKELAVQSSERHPHECPQCPKSFKKPSDLVRHIRIHTGEKPFSCKVCGRTFTVKSTLDSHMKTHGGFEKTIKCHICASMFSTKGSLKVHMRLHTGAKPFKCPHCPQRYRTSGHRKSHILSHYKDANTFRRKRSSHSVSIQEVPQTNDHMDYINQVDNGQTIPQVITQGQNQGQIQMGQVINIDQSMLNANMVPLSLTVDGFGNVTDNSVLQLQGLEGIPLQIPGGNLAQGIQITGLDQIGQTVHIDANILQQLQSGNFNVTLNPNQTADPNMVPNLANIQLQPMSIQEGVNPNLMVQPIGAIGIDQTGLQAGNQAAQIGLNQDINHGTFVMAGTNGMVTEQQVNQGQVITSHQQSQVVESGKTTGDSDISQGDLENIQQEKELMEELAADIDQDTSDMRAIDPNMTTNLPGSMMEESQTVSETEDGNGLNDTDIIQEHVNEDIDDDDNHDDDDNDEDINAANDLFISGSVIRNESGDPSRLFTCDICNKSFKRKSHVKEHMKTHLKSPGSQKDKPGFHACPYCDKRFQKPSQMDRHVRIHTGERPFGCMICGKAFNQKNALQIHLKKHSGERPHKCQYCDTAFTQKGNLKTHIKRAHHADMVNSMNIRKPTSKMTDDLTENSVNETVQEKDQVITQDITLGEVSDFFTS
ncbi:hypothetical protein ACF0H5_006698 [Mactra antiquata]